MSTRRCAVARVRIGACVLALALSLDAQGVDAQKAAGRNARRLARARRSNTSSNNGRALTSVLARGVRPQPRAPRLRRESTTEAVGCHSAPQPRERYDIDGVATSFDTAADCTRRCAGSLRDRRWRAIDTLRRSGVPAAARRVNRETDSHGARSKMRQRGWPVRARSARREPRSVTLDALSLPRDRAGRRAVIRRTGPSKPLVGLEDDRDRDRPSTSLRTRSGCRSAVGSLQGPDQPASSPHRHGARRRRGRRVRDAGAGWSVQADLSAA